MYKTVEILSFRGPRVEVLDNSLEILQLVSLLDSTELDQVNLILIRHIEAGPLIKTCIQL